MSETSNDNDRHVSAELLRAGSEGRTIAEIAEAVGLRAEAVRASLARLASAGECGKAGLVVRASEARPANYTAGERGYAIVSGPAVWVSASVPSEGSPLGATSVDLGSASVVVSQWVGDGAD